MKLKHFFYILVLSILTCLSYSNTLHSPFVYDDIAAIAKNSTLKIDKLSTDNIYNILRNSHAKRRIVSNITFALNYLHGKLDLPGYHIVNIGIHLCAIILVYLVFLEIFRLPVMKKYSDHAPEIAFAIAGLWGLNPVQTQAITYIVQRMTSLAAMFYMLSFYCYIRGSRAARKHSKTALYLMSFIAWIAAVGSKEIAITLPVIIFLYEYFFFAREDKAKLKKLAITGTLMAVLTMLIIFSLMEFQNPLEFLKSEEAFSKNPSEITRLQRSMSGARIVFYYISLILFPAPSRMMLMYNYPESKSLIEPFTTIIAIMTISTLIIFAFRLKKKPVISFFILWYFCNLVLESTLVKLFLVFEHRIYLPSIGIIAILVFIISSRMIDRKFKSTTQSIIFIPVMIALATATYSRNGAWKDEITFYEDNLEKNPISNSVRINLGIAYMNNDMPEKAMEKFDTAIRRSPENLKGYTNKGILLNKQGMYDKALEQFETAIKISPYSHAAHLHKGIALEKKNMLDLAMKEFNLAIELIPGYPLAYYNKGIVYNKTGMLDKAIEQFDIAIRLSPESFKPHYHKAVNYTKKWMLKEAISEFNMAISLDPENFKSHYYKGRIYSNMKNYKEAVLSLQAAKEIRPDDYNTRVELAEVYIKTGDTDKAVRELTDAVGLDKEKDSEETGNIEAPSAYGMLGDLYIKKKEFKQAREAYLNGLEENPQKVGLLFKIGLINARNPKSFSSPDKYLKLFLEKAHENQYKKEREIASTLLARKENLR